MIKGSAVAYSGGIVFGTVQKLDGQQSFISEYKIEETDVAQEVDRFKQAVFQASQALQQEINALAQHPHAQDLLPILQAHDLMLQDPALVDTTICLIQDKYINAEWALKKCVSNIVQTFEAMQDTYLRSRKADIEHVGQCIFTLLAGSQVMEHASQSIVIASSFSPVEIMAMWRSGVSGFVSSQGGEDSHAMILARGVGLSGLAGVHDLFEQAEDGDMLILDAEQGDWILHPSSDETTHYQALQTKLDQLTQALEAYVCQPSLSKDGCHLPLMANLEFVEEVEVAQRFGVDGVGLFRTEFLFMQSKTLPTEQEQTTYYQNIIQGMSGKPVTFRLLDVGADKLEHMEVLLGLYAGENPALGLRGVRMLLHRPELLRTQLKAIVRHAELAQISILVPMVVSSKEMLAIRQMLNEVRQELGVEQAIPLGCMIEVPAAALVADELARVSDFFSIGSNDLVQYSLAVDRADEHVSYLYDANHPAIQSLIQMAVDAAHRQGIPVTVCGELAANLNWTQTFLDMGVSGLSMTAKHVLPVRKHLQDLQAKA